MATIRKRGRSWQVQVRQVGFPPISKSFGSKAEAVSWAKDRKRAGSTLIAPPERCVLPSLTLGQLLERYLSDVSAHKKGHVSERSRILNMMKRPVSLITITELSSHHFADYRNSRIKVVGPDTVRRELSIFRHCIEISRREWGIPLRDNPLHKIKFPKPSLPREERLPVENAKELYGALSRLRNKHIRSLVICAIETGMRRSELLSLQWPDICLDRKVATLRDTKNGRPRTVPLTPRAVFELAGSDRASCQVFPVSGNAVRLSWERLRVKAGLPTLRFHDLRHEAVSRFFEMGLSIPEVALISGHKDYKMLARYTNLRPTDIAEKLARLTPT